MRIPFYLTYIYYRKIFPKGDILTISLLLGVLLYALYALYFHYDNLYGFLWLLPLGVFMYHNSRKDLSLLKAHPYYRAIFIGEYFLENLPFVVLPLLKRDFTTAVLISLSFIGIAFLPQKSFSLKYPFSLTDPLWHIAFRKYKLIAGLAIAIGLIVIARVYENPNLALFALGLTAFVGCVPYFEREFHAHIAVASARGKDYLLQQLKTGLINTTILFSPVLIVYLCCFQGQFIEVLPLFLVVPILGVLSKYAFWNHILGQIFALIGISFGVIYIIPIIAIPYIYYLAIQNIKKLQYAGYSDTRKALF